MKDLVVVRRFEVKENHFLVPMMRVMSLVHKQQFFSDIDSEVVLISDERNFALHHKIVLEVERVFDN